MCLRAVLRDERYTQVSTSMAPTVFFYLVLTERQINDLTIKVDRDINNAHL